MKKVILAAALLSSQISFAHTVDNDLLKYQINSSVKLFLDVKDNSQIAIENKCRLAGAAEILMFSGYNGLFGDEMQRYTRVDIEKTYEKFAESGKNVMQTIINYNNQNCSILN